MQESWEFVFKRITILQIRQVSFVIYSKKKLLTLGTNSKWVICFRFYVLHSILEFQLDLKTSNQCWMLWRVLFYVGWWVIWLNILLFYFQHDKDISVKNCTQYYLLEIHFILFTAAVAACYAYAVSICTRV